MKKRIVFGILLLNLCFATACHKKGATEADSKMVDMPTESVLYETNASSEDYKAVNVQIGNQDQLSREQESDIKDLVRRSVEGLSEDKIEFGYESF